MKRANGPTGKGYIYCVYYTALDTPFTESLWMNTDECTIATLYMRRRNATTLQQEEEGIKRMKRGKEKDSSIVPYCNNIL